MKMLPKVAFVVAATLVAGTTLAQDKCKVQTLLIGNATANDTQAAGNDKFAELLTKYSNGCLQASARHGASLGDNRNMIAQLQAGSIHGMQLPAGFISGVVPEIALFDLPFLLPGRPALITAFAAQSKAAAEMKKLAEKKGILVLSFHGIGPQSFLTKFPVSKLSDIQNKKFRVIPSPPRVGAYQDWGAIARPMEFSEVYTALQQGTLDGMENPPDVLYKMKMHEVAKYYTVTEHFAFASAIIVSKRWFDRLPKNLKDVVLRAGKETTAFDDTAYTKSQDESFDLMCKAITCTEMPKEEIQKMRDLTRNGVWKRMEADEQRGPIVKLLLADVARFEKMKK